MHIILANECLVRNECWDISTRPMCHRVSRFCCFFFVVTVVLRSFVRSCGDSWWTFDSLLRAIMVVHARVRTIFLGEEENDCHQWMNERRTKKCDVMESRRRGHCNVIATNLFLSVCVCVLRFYFLMIIFCLPFSPLASLLFTALYCHFVRQTLQQMCGHLASVMSVTLLAMEIFSHRLTNFTRSRLNDDDVSYHLTKKDVTHLFFNRCSVMSTVQIPFTD